MLTLRYLAQAKDDIIEIKRYIEGECGSEDVALQFTDKLREQCRRLAELPGQLGRPRPELRCDLRSFPYGNYVIFFIYGEQYLDIITIIEGHRDLDAHFEE